MTNTLTIEPLGQSIEVQDGQTILDATLRAGIYLPHACCHGLCATCKIEVVDGEIDHGDASNFALMDYEREERKCLACCATLQSDVTIEADVEFDMDAQNIPVQDYIGTVERIENLTPTIKGVWIRLQKPMTFQAGQYVNLTINGTTETRAFSLANAPSANDLIELNIRLVLGGQATTWVHEALKIGDSLSLSGPYGRFFVRASAQLPMIFMAGGSGLSSPKSMVADLLEHHCALPITLVYGARTMDELYDHDLFVQWSGEYSNFTYVPAVSDAPSTPPNVFSGFVHDAAKAHFNNDFRGHKAYLCGPPVMIEACISTLMQGRLFERDIYTEKFLSAADTAQQMRSPLFKRL